MTTMQRARGRLAGVFVLAIASASCAAPATPAPGTGSVFGSVQVVPRSDLPARVPGAGSYGDRALRDVTFVDYARPGFAVVYVESETPPAIETTLAIRQPGRALRLEPDTGVATTAGAILVTNETGAARIVSDASGDVLRRIAPGETIRIDRPRSGLHRIKLLGEPTRPAEVFVTPGPHARVSERGRFELAGIRPGPVDVHTWHVRFPATVTHARIAAGERLRMDVSLGVEAALEGSLDD